MGWGGYVPAVGGEEEEGAKTKVLHISSSSSRGGGVVLDRGEGCVVGGIGVGDGFFGAGISFSWVFWGASFVGIGIFGSLIVAFFGGILSAGIGISGSLIAAFFWMVSLARIVPSTSLVAVLFLIGVKVSFGG